MKAEHRKQLQTNALADRMGRLVQTLKQRPQKRTVLYVVLGLAVLLGLFIYLRYRSAQAAERSRLWVWLDNGHKVFIDELAGAKVQGDRISLPANWEYKDTNAGKAARFHFAWLFLWDKGINRLAADHTGALHYLDFAQSIYTRLAEDCKDDPVWEPEAHYALAVIKETFAVKDPKHLDEAREMYDSIATKFRTSAAGMRAEKRAEMLKPASRSREDINKFYYDLRTDLRIDPKKLERLDR